MTALVMMMCAQCICFVMGMSMDVQLPIWPYRIQPQTKNKSSKLLGFLFNEVYFDLGQTQLVIGVHSTGTNGTKHIYNPVHLAITVLNINHNYHNILAATGSPVNVVLLVYRGEVHQLIVCGSAGVANGNLLFGVGHRVSCWLGFFTEIKQVACKDAIDRIAPRALHVYICCRCCLARQVFD